MKLKNLNESVEDLLLEAQFDAELDILLEGVFGDAAAAIKTKIKAVIANVKKAAADGIAVAKKIAKDEMHDTKHMTETIIEQLKAFLGKHPQPTKEQLLHALSQMGDIMKVISAGLVIASPFDDMLMPVFLAIKYLDVTFNSGATDFGGLFKKYILPRQHYDEQGEEIYHDEFEKALEAA